MAKDGFVQVPPNSTGAEIDCSSLSVAGQVVMRQRVVVGDPTRSANFALVSAGSMQVTVQNTVPVSGQVSVTGSVAISNTVTVQGQISVTGGVVLNAGTFHIGEVNVSLMPQVSVLNVAGVAHMGEVNISLMPAVVLAAGAANIGTINNISAGVVLAAGAAHVGEVNVSIMPAVVLAAGAANIGSINGISANVNVVIASGANNIGFLNGISATIVAAMVRVKFSSSAAIADNTVTMSWADRFGRQVVINNHPALLPSASHGPKTVTLSTSTNAALVAAPGASNSIYVTALTITNGSATLTRADAYTGTGTAAPEVAQYLAASGGGFTMKFDPPWQISANTALNARVKPNVSQALATIHFYVGPA